MNSNTQPEPQEPQKRPLTEREILLRDSFTAAEFAVFAIVLLAYTVSILTAGPRSFWALGTYIILAPLSIATVKLHEIVHPFKIEHLWRRYALLLIPVLCLAFQHTIGLIFPTIESLQIDKEAYYVITEKSAWLPVSTPPNTFKTTLTLFGFISIFILSLNLYFIPKSLVFFNKLLAQLCLFAVVCTVVGILYKVLGSNQPFFIKGSNAKDFFAYFPYDGHWAAFACLWCGVSFAFTFEQIRHDTDNNFLKTKGPWFLASAIMLGFSGIFIQASNASAILLLFLSWMLLRLGIQFIRFSHDRHQKSISALCTLGSCCLFALAVFRLAAPDPNKTELAMLNETALQLFLERPLFGWGFESFPQISAFYNNDALLGALNLSPPSGILHYLSEFGLFGCLVIAAFLLTLLLAYRFSKQTSHFSNNLLLAIATVLIIAIIDNPFMSPTVTLSCCIVFFSAFRFATIEANKTDLVDIQAPQLVSPASERNVPFFTGEQNDREI